MKKLKLKVTRTNFLSQRNYFGVLEFFLLPCELSDHLNKNDDFTDSIGGSTQDNVAAHRSYQKDF